MRKIAVFLRIRGWLDFYFLL